MTPGASAPARAGATGDVARTVLAGLASRPKRLPPWLLYDEEGQALFRKITALPEYYLTRAERTILRLHGAAMVAAAGPPLSVVELGAGCATKTAVLLDAVLRAQPRALYVPTDVSAAALARAASRLPCGRPGLEVRPIVARYPEQLGFLDQVPPRRLVLFLGSTVGNHGPAEAAALLRSVRERLAPGDALLLGTDLRKPAAVVLPAYDDRAGITARFNKNLLLRINRELGGRFDPETFRHVALWNARRSRIEMHLESVRGQVVPVEQLGMAFLFAAGERLLTEHSYKFTRPMITELLARGGFSLEESWYDAERRFAVHLARA